MMRRKKKPRENWNWESSPASTAHLVRWTRLHMKLVPYLESIAHRSHDGDGLGLVRPVALAWPGAGDWAWTTTDQYVLGDRILVAPVVTAGATSRPVALPPGRFHPLLGGPGVDGGATIEVSAPKAEIPAFVAGGTLLLLYPDGVDTVVDAPDDPAIVTAASIGGDRDLWLWPGDTASAAQRSASEGAAGSPGYVWSPRRADLPLPTVATWNGSPISLAASDGSVEVTLTGSGTLRFDGGGELEATGGEASRTLRVNVPTVSSEDANAISPYRLISPYVGLNPTTPDSDAGCRTEPPVSVPSAQTASPAATAAALPPLEPPGTIDRSHGLCTGPNAEFSFDEPIANSSQLVLPSSTAPSAFRRSHGVQSNGGTYVSRIFEPQVVRTPRVESTSFSASGMPAAAGASPAAMRSSTARACDRARSSVGVRNAFTRSSTAPIRARHASRISTADTSRARSFSPSSEAVRSQSSVTRPPRSSAP